MGIVVLPTVISYSRILSKLSIGLDKRPDLVASLTNRQTAVGSEDAFERVTLVETSANVIREAFKKCLSERSGIATGGVTVNGKPEGRRVGIYLCANMCLRLFFRCKKLRSAEQIFGNIYQQSPPLSCFPAAQRVTYLYYLGRYHFANNHFPRAALVLQAAYDQCHSQCLSQRHKIVIYLITSNVILGRFPGSKLLSRPECADLYDKFIPICHAIRKGDLRSFRALLSLSHPNSDWYLHWRILFQLQNRCEVLVLRSLARRIFLLSGWQPDSDNVKKAATLDLADLRDAISILTGASVPLVDPDILDLSDYEESEGSDSGSNLHVEEAEAIVQSLIQQDLLQGYVSHKLGKFAITGTKATAPLQAGFPNVWKVIEKKVDKDEIPGWVQKFRGAGAVGTVVKLSNVKAVGEAPIE